MHCIAYRLRLQGLGEGEGAKDISDQIEDEDQLLGAKQRDAPESEKVGFCQPCMKMPH